MSLTVHAPAKINLTLDVTGRRADGYHTLTSIFQTVSRYDTVTLTKTTAGVTLETPGGAPCPPEKNTAYRAAQAFFAHTGIAGGVALTLTKRIPQQAGMGGGSADGAAVLAGLDRLYDTHLSPETLRAMAAAIGADVPFCLVGGTALVQGIGEQVEPLSPLPPVSVVIAQPSERVDTAAAYRALDCSPIRHRPDHPAALAALRENDPAALWEQIVNVFEPALALPGVAAIRREMAAFAPLASQMTGSGSAVFGLFSDPRTAQRCAARLAEQFPVAFVCTPCVGMIFE